MNKFSFDRYASLMRYDWEENKRSFGMMLSIVVMVYVVLNILIFIFAEAFDTGYNVQGIHFFTSLFFAFSCTAIVLYVTTILHRKFTKTATSLSYMTLPTSSTEKWLAMLTDYIVADVCISLLYFIFYYVTSIVGFCFDSTQDWLAQSPISPIIEAYNKLNIQIDQITTEIAVDVNSADPAFLPACSELIQSVFGIFKAYIIMCWPVSWTFMLYYMILNMCFKHNGQIKSVLIYLVTVIVLVLGTSFMTGFVFGLCLGDGDVKTDVINNFIIVSDTIRYLVYCVPLLLALELWGFYKQIKNKQAK